MLLQTNSYIVPRQHQAEHARLLARFQKALVRIGCDLFEVYQQADANWEPTEGECRFVQILRFRDREHQQAVRAAERLDLEAQSLIEEFCRLINFPYQQEHGLFAVGFYTELQSELLPGSSESEAQAIEEDLDDSSVKHLPSLRLAMPDSDDQAEPEEKAPATEVQRSDVPPADEELDELLNAQFTPASAPIQPVPAGGDPELARVLDAGLAFDDLDIPMEAELLDEPESDDEHPVSTPDPIHQPEH